MTLANWAVLAACLMPVLTVAMAKATMARIPRRNGGYDNHNPREWEAKQEGWKQRAVAAQLNGFEILPLFIAAVLMAQQAHADQAKIDQLAVAFVATRVVYVAMYLKDWASARSLVWFAGVVTSIAIMMLA